jgi:hypothetical protein
MMLWLSFVGAPCPSEWGAILETTCNLINTILTSDNWNPLEFLASDSQHLIPPKCTLPDNVPFGIGCDLIVDIPVNLHGTINVYIDNFIGLTVNLKGSDNTTPLEHAPLLSVVQAYVDQKVTR